MVRARAFSILLMAGVPALAGFRCGNGSARATSATVVRAAAPPTSPAGAGPDWPMFGYVPARTSDGPATTGITAANTASLRRLRVKLPGIVDSSPIYVHQVGVGGAMHDVFVVTTSYGKTLAIDAGSGAILWTYTPANYDSWEGSYQVTTAAPVMDPDRAHVYASAPDGMIRKLALTDGREVWVTAITLLPRREKITSALNFDGGHVIAATGGYIGDRPPYQGHVAVLDASSGRIVNVWNSLCSDRRGLIEPSSCRSQMSAVWARRGVVVEPETHRLLAATGNGNFDGKTDWGDSVVELAPDASSLIGHWTPTDYQRLDDTDGDIGSTGPALMAGGYVVQGGKDGRLRLFQLQRTSAVTTGGEAQTVPAPGGDGLYADPAVGSGGSMLYVANGSGTEAWRLANGRLAKVWGNGTGGTSPVLAGGLLYVYDPRGGLVVYQPDTGQRVAALPADRGHWQSPVVSDGRVALAEGNSNDHATTGVLNIYMLP